jgi:branched-chain amino acid transport system permease protein
MTASTTTGLADYRVVRTSRASIVGTTAFAAAAFGLALFPFFGSAGTQITLVEIFYYLSLAQMWNLLAGYAGLVSVGQQGFVGISAYTLFVLAEKNSVDPFLSIVVAAAFVAVLSIPVALFAFRLEGGYFAIGTWVIAEVFRLATLQIDSLGAGNVQSLTTRNALAGYSIEQRQDLVYWVALGLAAGGTLIVVLVLRSRIGLAIRAVRDDLSGARGLGVDVTRTRLVIWVIAAGWTGATGALIHINSATITNQSSFSVLSWTALVIFIVIIGGVGSPVGPIIGVVVFWVITDQLENQDTWRFIILGSVAAVMAVVAPNGIYGQLQRLRSFELFPVARRLVGADRAGDTEGQGG